MPLREMTVRVLRIAIAAAVIVPCLLFAYASWVSFRSANTLADERIVRSLDVQQEQAVKAFHLIDNTLNDAADLVAGLSDDQIRAEESQLHFEFGKLVRSVPAVESIWIYDPTGIPLVTSWVEHPPLHSFADRDFFQAHLRPGTGMYYGKVVRIRCASILHDHPSPGDGWRLCRGPGSVRSPQQLCSFLFDVGHALLRDDGAILARYPDGQPGAPDVLGKDTAFRRTTARAPDGGLYTTTSPVDGIERRFGVRRFNSTPVYLSAGIASSTIRSERSFVRGRAHRENPRQPAATRSVGRRSRLLRGTASQLRRREPVEILRGRFAMEGFVATKLDEFDRGKISRRHLIEALTFAASSAYAAADGAKAEGSTLKVALVNHISYSCPNFRQAADWYSKVFNLE
jgi:hypothetical protein